MNAVLRAAAGSLLALIVATPAAAQRPGSNAERLPPHVQQQLWPERELSETEQELHDRVVVMRDTLTRVHATIALLQRQHRSGAGAGVIRSTARTLASDCARAERTAGTMATFAADLSTDDTQWGEPSVRAFRAAIGDLVPAMGRCNTSLTDHAASDQPDGQQVVAEALRAEEVVNKYDRAERDLLRTLKIRVDPRSSGSASDR